METIGQYKLIMSNEGTPDDKCFLGSNHISMVEELLEKGEKHIAISLDGINEQPHSRQISFLIQCYSKVAPVGGRIAAIVPDNDLYTLLTDMGIPSIIRIFKTENEMRRKCSETP